MALAACGGGGGGSDGDGGTEQGNLEVELGYHAMANSYEVWTQVTSAATLNGLNGNTPHCSLSGGSLPSGLSVNSKTCDIEGTPNETGTFNFTTRLTVSGFSGHVDANATVVITGPYFNYEFGPEGVAWGESFASTQPSYNTFWPSSSDQVTYRLDEAAPSWVRVNRNTGVLSGTPNAADGEVEFTVYADIVHDGHKVTAQTTQLRILVNSPGIYYPTGTSGTVGAAFSIDPQIPAGFLSGGFTLEFHVDEGFCSIPAGLSLNPTTGRLSGTPTEEAFDCMIPVAWSATKGDLHFESFDFARVTFTN